MPLAKTLNSQEKEAASRPNPYACGQTPRLAVCVLLGLNS